jgi:hypothetical protein
LKANKGKEVINGHFSILILIFSQNQNENPRNNSHSLQEDNWSFKSVDSNLRTVQDLSLGLTGQGIQFVSWTLHSSIPRTLLRLIFSFELLDRREFIYIFIFSFISTVAKTITAVLSFNGNQVEEEGCHCS